MSPELGLGLNEVWNQISIGVWHLGFGDNQSDGNYERELDALRTIVDIDVVLQ